MKNFISICVLGTLALLLACDNDEPVGPNLAFGNAPPPSPRNLKVDKIRDGEIWLSWERVNRDGIDYYVVYRSAGGGQVLEVSVSIVTLLAGKYTAILAGRSDRFKVLYPRKFSLTTDSY